MVTGGWLIVIFLIAIAILLITILKFKVNAFIALLVTTIGTGLKMCIRDRIDPCIPADWKEFSVKRVWRGAEYRISVKNPEGVMKGVKELILDGKKVSKIPAFEAGSSHEVTVVMGNKEENHD